MPICQCQQQHANRAQCALLPSRLPLDVRVSRLPEQVINACVVPAATVSGGAVGLGYAPRHPSEIVGAAAARRIHAAIGDWGKGVS